MFAILVHHIHKSSKSQMSEEYLKKFGTFFEEFRCEPSKYCLFYLLFVIRRMILVFLIVFIENEIVQLYFSFVCSLTVINS